MPTRPINDTDPDSPLGGLHEHDANVIIADWLDKQKEWSASGERTNTIQGGSDIPDILIQDGDRMPVIIETEYVNPAVSDAKKRLGKRLVNDPRTFTELIALGIGDKVKNTNRASLMQLLDANDSMFTVQFVSRRNDLDRVWPDTPISATPSDLVAYCEYAQVPQNVIEDKTAKISDRLAAASKSLESLLRELERRSEIIPKVQDAVGCDDLYAATRTACAIWMIAVDLQNDLATYSRALIDEGLKTVNKENNSKGHLIDSWKTIKKVNYLPVVELAIDSLEPIPDNARNLGSVLDELVSLSEELSHANAKHIYNFAGELWQNITVDREERAAHYTKPEVAELLSRLGALRFSDRSADELAKIDLMDAACGTGTLIGAGERALRRLHREKIGGGKQTSIVSGWRII